MRCRAAVLMALALGQWGTAWASQPKEERPAQVKKSQSQGACWSGEHEVKNTNPVNHRPTKLPSEFASEPTQRSALLFKLCVSENGDVPRVIVLQSSGNANVDKYYTNEMSSWKVRPARKDNRNVRSVVTVAVTLYVK